MQGRARPDGLTGGRALATSDSSHEMAANGPPDLLIELLVAAARTSGGEVGLLRTGQVADVLGRRRDWVTAHAGLLRGFQLPGSDEWRFSARGVAIGVFDLDDADPMLPEAPAEVTRAHNVGRLAYPPARQILDDKPRQARTTNSGARHASRRSRQR